MKITSKLRLENEYTMVLLLGENDCNLHEFEQKYGVKISSRGNNLAIYGNPQNVANAKESILKLYNEILMNQSSGMKMNNIKMHIDRANLNHEDNNKIVIKTRKASIINFNAKQGDYLNAIEKKDVVFSIGPAGTGKTYLAVAMAVKMFLNKDVERIILTRPAIEAGERLGFLPGDMKEKVDPYLRPLYDALYSMLPGTDVDRYFITKEIEIAPLAFMRGRTLNKSFIILDEGQNTTKEQMKMFLTRLGDGSKMVITGDLTQIDLPNNEKSGLMDAVEKLKSIEGIGIVKFSSLDVTRHPLTAKIIEAYEQSRT